MAKDYSDPADQQTLADALSQSAGPYSTDNLVSALRKKDESRAAPLASPSGPGMAPWALDAPPVKTQAEQRRATTPPTPEMAAAMQQQQAAAEQQANQQRLQAAQMAPDTSGGPGGAPPGAPGQASMQPAQAPSPRPQTVPEHWVNTMDPASRAAMAAGQQEQLGGVGDQATAESQAADEMASTAYHGHEDARVQQLLDQQRLDPERQKLDQHAQQLQAQAEKLSTAKVDPEHYMASKSAGSKVLMAIGMGLSGFGAGLRGGSNTSVDMIKGAIDDDNRAQMQNIENSKTGLKDQQGILADKMRLFGNKEQALAAARQEQLQGVAAQVDDIARAHQSPDIQAKAQQLKGELQQHFAAEGAAVQKYAPAQTVGGASAGMTPAQLDAYEQKLVLEGRMEPNAAHAERMRMESHDYAQNPSKFYEKGAGGAPMATTLPGHLSSTNWEPQRHIQGTDAAQHQRENERFNAGILAFAHSKGIRDPEKAREAYKAYIIEPGDSQKTVDEKLKASRALLSGGAQSGDAAAETPPGFEE